MSNSSHLGGVPTLDKTQQAPANDAASVKSERPGVVQANRIKAVLTRRDIHIAFAFLIIATLAASFQDYTVSTYTSYATSAFKAHSQLTTAAVINKTLSIVSYCLIAKIADVYGRISPTLFAVMLMFIIIRDAMIAGCKNVQTYLGAQVFVGIGATGWNILQQIYIAETTTIVSRGLWSVLPDAIGVVITMYSGTEIAQHMLDHYGVLNGWRWGYGMFCIIIFVCTVPFIAVLASWQHRARVHEKATGYVKDPNRERHTFFDLMLNVFDIPGFCLLGAGLALVLVPLTLAKGVAEKWDSNNIAMICVGFGLLILFGLWDSAPKSFRPKWLPAPRYPLVPWHLLSQPTVLAICCINFFDFMSYGLFATMFPSYLQVSAYLSAANASRVDNSLRIVFQVFAVLTGLLMRYYTQICRKLGFGERVLHTKYLILTGVPLCFIGIALDINFVMHPERKSAIGSFVIAKVLWGIGRALYQTAAQVTIQVAAQRGELAVATGIFYVATSTGGTIGTAIDGAIWNDRLPVKLLEFLPETDKSKATSIFKSFTVAMKFARGSDTRIAINKSYDVVMQYIAIAATCVQIPMLIAMFFVKNIELVDRQEGPGDGISDQPAAASHGHLDEKESHPGTPASETIPQKA